MGKAIVVVSILLVAALAWGASVPAANSEIELIGTSGDPATFNRFEVYTFKHNQHRCFVAVKQDGNIDLDCS